MGIELLLKLVLSLISAGAGAGMLADSVNNTAVLWAIGLATAWIVYMVLKFIFMLIEKYHKPIILLETGTIGLLVWVHWFVK